MRCDLPSRVVVVGDLHADIEVFTSILVHRQLINGLGRWIGGATWVVCMGDTLDGRRPEIDVAPDYASQPMELLLTKYILQLDTEAQRVDGRCISIMGNHDMFAYELNSAPYCKWSDYKSYPEPREELYAPGMRLARIFAETRPLVLVLGKYLFVHGGLSQRIMEQAPGAGFDKLDALNSQVAVWLRHGKDMPDWADSSSNPVFSRAYAIGGTEEALDAILEQLPGVQHMVVGHTVKPEILSRFHGKVICTDVALSRAFGGEHRNFTWQIMEIVDGQPHVITLQDGQMRRSTILKT